MCPNHCTKGKAGFSTLKEILTRLKQLKRIITTKIKTIKKKWPQLKTRRQKEKAQEKVARERAKLAALESKRNAI